MLVEMYTCKYWLSMDSQRPTYRQHPRDDSNPDHLLIGQYSIHHFGPSKGLDNDPKSLHVLLAVKLGLVQ